MISGSASAVCYRAGSCASPRSRPWSGLGQDPCDQTRSRVMCLSGSPEGKSELHRAQAACAALPPVSSESTLAVRRPKKRGSRPVSENRICCVQSNSSRCRSGGTSVMCGCVYEWLAISKSGFWARTLARPQWVSAHAADERGWAGVWVWTRTRVTRSSVKAAVEVEQASNVRAHVGPRLRRARSLRRDRLETVATGFSTGTAGWVPSGSRAARRGRQSRRGDPRPQQAGSTSSTPQVTRGCVAI